MSASEIAEKCFTSAIADAETAGLGSDTVCRYLLGMIVRKYLEKRPVADVRSELVFLAENCDPDTDYTFMRP